MCVCSVCGVDRRFTYRRCSGVKNIMLLQRYPVEPARARRSGQKPSTRYFCVTSAKVQDYTYIMCVSVCVMCIYVYLYYISTHRIYSYKYI